VAHQIYKGCSSWIKKAGTSDSATNAEKRFKYKKEKRPEWIVNAKWCEAYTITVSAGPNSFLPALNILTEISESM
jgi:hypothetical protein